MQRTVESTLPGHRPSMDGIALSAVAFLLVAAMLALVRNGIPEGPPSEPPPWAPKSKSVDRVLPGEVPIYILVTEDDVLATFRASDGGPVISTNRSGVAAQLSLIEDQNKIMAELGQPPFHPVLIRLVPATFVSSPESAGY